MSKSIQLKDVNNENYYPHPYYPVGSIYLSVSNTNPSKWFGGTWELISQGRTLVGVDTNDTDFNTVKKTGGSKYLQQHNHASLLIDGNRIWWGGTSSQSKLNLLPLNMPWNGGADGSAIVTGEAGTGNSGNLQPYFTCYIWCRTA